MKPEEFLKQREFILSDEHCEKLMSLGSNMIDVWEELIKQHEYLLLLIVVTSIGIFSKRVWLKISCRLIKEIPLESGGTIWESLSDSRSKNAVEVAEKYVDAKVSDEEIDYAKSEALLASLAANNAANNDVDNISKRHANDSAYAVLCCLNYCNNYMLASLIRTDNPEVQAAQIEAFSKFENPFK